MNIRRKTMLLYMLTVVGVLVLFLAGAKVILLERLAQLERDDVRLDVDRVLSALGGLLEAMQATAKDYGNWDDTCAYLDNQNNSFIQSNFMDATFQNLKLDMVILGDARGEVVYSQGYDQNEKQMRDIPESWTRLFRGHGFFGQEVMQDESKVRRGLVQTVEGPLMVVVKSVLTSEEKGPSHGVLIMGRLLGNEEVERLSQLALLKISWLTLDQLPLAVDLLETGDPSPVSGVPVVVRPVSRDTVEGLCLARDMQDAPIGAWRIEQERRLYAKGRDGTVYFLVVMMAGGVVFTLGFALILERVVLGRLARFSSQVEAIAFANDPSGRVDVSGQDEIGDLAASINAMMDGLERSSRDLRAIAEELRAARDQAQDASQAKSRFLATMSHEIRTPLNALAGFTELACDVGAGGNVREYLEDIRGASNHLRTLIEDILDFSKIEAGRLELETVPFHLGRLAEEVGMLFRNLAKAKGIGFDLAVSQGARTRVLGDPLRLRQVLSNLLDNALKFTEEGTVHFRIDASGPETDYCVGAETGPGPGAGSDGFGAAPGPGAEPEVLAVRFEVSDTGIGIAPNALAQVFTPFTQEDSSTTRRFGGTGLGLAICREIVSLMGSDLKVESQAGKGSRFYFETVFEKAAAQEPAEKSGLAKGDLGGALVLVAEDNAFNRKLVKQMLEAAGASTVLAEDGKQAVLAALEHDLDLVLMDMHMPEMDGLEAARVLRGHPCCKDLPIIALTAGVLAGDREKCLESGMNDYLTKPVTRQALLEAAGAWITGGKKDAPGPVPEKAGKQAAGPALPPLPGVDMPAALAIYEANTGLTARILAQFPESFADVCSRIGGLIDKGDIKQAWMEAHGLKGAAASICATGAAGLARRLEEALSQNDADAGKKLLAELDPVLLSLFDAISAFVAAYKAQDNTER